MGQILKCRPGHYKTLRGKPSQNTLWHKPQPHLFRYTSQTNKNKNKCKQMGPAAATAKLLLKGLCTAKEPINEMKRQLRMGKNICKQSDW